MLCENNSWQWVSEMWWPSTGSLEFCQYGGPALIIKNTFTGRISAASVVSCSLQGHMQDNHTEKKFGNIAVKKNNPNTAVSYREVITGHGCKTSLKNIFSVFFFSSLANWIIQLLYFVFVIDSRCLVCSFPPSLWSFFCSGQWIVKEASQEFTQS